MVLTFSSTGQWWNLHLWKGSKTVPIPSASIPGLFKELQVKKKIQTLTITVKCFQKCGKNLIQDKHVLYNKVSASSG